MRIFAYLYHGLLALFLLGISGLALFSGTHNLRLDMLPWTGKTLTWAVFLAALCGLALVLLALKGTLRVLFFIWTVAVLIMMFRGYFLGSYFFRSGELQAVVLLNAGALLAAVGGWFVFRRRTVKRVF